MKFLRMLLLGFLALAMLSCSSQKRNNVIIKSSTGVIQNPNNPPKLTSLNFPYLDSAEHQAFLQLYYKDKLAHNLLMTPENMTSIKSIYFQELVRFEEAYEAHKKKFCQEKKIDQSTKKRFLKNLPQNMTAIQKELIKETIIAVYLKTEKDCKHVNQDLYQHSMLENLTLEVKLIDDLMAFYEKYQGDKSRNLKASIEELKDLRLTCEHYYTLILPNDLEEYFFNTFIDQLDPQTLKYLKQEFKGKPFDSVTLLAILKEK